MLGEKKNHFCAESNREIIPAAQAGMGTNLNQGCHCSNVIYWRQLNLPREYCNITNFCAAYSQLEVNGDEVVAVIFFHRKGLVRDINPFDMAKTVSSWSTKCRLWSWCLENMNIACNPVVKQRSLLLGMDLILDKTLYRTQFSREDVGVNVMWKCNLALADNTSKFCPPLSATC